MYVTLAWGYFRLTSLAYATYPCRKMLLCGRRSKGGLGVALVRASCSTMHLLTLLSSSSSFQWVLAWQCMCGRGAQSYISGRENGRPASMLRGLSASIKERGVISRQSIATRFASLRDAKLIPFAPTICFCCSRLINLTKTERVSARTLRENRGRIHGGLSSCRPALS